MHPAYHTTGLSRIMARVILALLVCASALVLTHCRMVGDKLTGVEVSPERARSCLRNCERTKEAALQNEEDLHRQNMRACGREDDRPRDRGCRERERQRHKDAVRAILDAFKQCVSECHHQGGGSGR